MIRRLFLVAAVIVAFACHRADATSQPDEPWPGVDETVVEKFAAAAGRPSREPLINTDQGDLLLFLFLTAGLVGGFVAGYSWRALFPPRRPRGDAGA